MCEINQWIDEIKNSKKLNNKYIYISTNFVYQYVT